MATQAEPNPNVAGTGQGLYLAMKRYKLSEIPPEEQLYVAAEKIIQDMKTWKKGKTYNRHNTVVHTMSRPKGPKDDAPWFGRHSVHPASQATFDQLWEGLGVDKAVKEAEFIPELKQATLLKQVAENQFLQSLYYEFPPPVSPRVFTELQIMREPFGEAGSREAYIISLPIDLSDEKDLASKEQKGVRARYVSVEYIKGLPDGNTEWSMATSSSIGGLMPNIIVEMSMASSIAKDVPHFVDWLKTHGAK